MPLTPPRSNDAISGIIQLPSTDAGERIYAVGDVHGRFDLLQKLIERIGEHNGALPPAKSLHMLFLGDLIDRGPQSAQVLKFLHDLQRKTSRILVLQGNHEEALLQSIDGNLEVLEGWLRFGGAQTLESFGLASPGAGDDLRLYLREVRSAIPALYIEWIRRLPLTARSGDYFFCHAGVRPGVALRRQTREDLLWIRDDFLADPRHHGAVIVHGHSIETDVQLRDNRIGIDTGAYRTGILTAIYLEDDKQELISVSMA
ncbi:metallophosphoesterase family protein [Sphingobium psychrophilum]|uniref:metallophosphoesterase family protein n=1 Tax=Sphingobium psychrophilum TaxID=2728834 RepID=UPI001F3D8E35|nr:metallophosphoesterase family protein [Sphingobium psychrophilum]